MDLQPIEDRLRANEAGRDGELYEHAPEDIRALIAEVERLTAQIDAVREHHVPVEANYYAATVTECCSCPGPWPCPTIRALEVQE